MNLKYIQVLFSIPDVLTATFHNNHDSMSRQQQRMQSSAVVNMMRRGYEGGASASGVMCAATISSCRRLLQNQWIHNFTLEPAPIFLARQNLLSHFVQYTHILGLVGLCVEGPLLIYSAEDAVFMRAGKNASKISSFTLPSGRQQANLN